MLSKSISALIKDSQGEQTNPTTSTVLATTGAVSATGYYEVIVTASASANAQFQFQHRNAADDGNTSDALGFYILANSVGQFREVVFLNASERCRVMVDANLTGTAWAYLTAIRIQ